MSLQQLKERALQSDDVRREYDALASEFTLISQLLHMRKAAGLTQEQVAVLMHTKKSNISRLEKGAVTPKVDTLQRYAKACGYELHMSFEPQAVG